MRTCFVIRAFFVATLLVPVGALAAMQGRSLLTLQDHETVSRGAFLQASLEALQLAPGNPADIADLKNVPKALRPAVAAAKREGALDILGEPLRLTRGITRGEAVELLGKLAHVAGTVEHRSFDDVTEGSQRNAAIDYALAHGWIRTLRASHFGADMPLTAKEARAVLAKVQVEKPQSKVPAKIVIRLVPKDAVAVPKQETLQQVWNLLNDNYLYPDKIDADEAMYSAMEALVKTTKDPYTFFMRPPANKAFHTQISKDKGSGIGALVEMKDGILTIMSPLKDSPAQKAGIMPGDQILMVDGDSLEGLTLEEAVAKVRGPEGSEVNLRISRNGEQLNVAIVRAVIVIPDFRLSWQGSIAIVELLQFGEGTDLDFPALMEEVQSRHPTGVILDVRKNPGGLLHAADVVLSTLLPKGSPILRVDTRDGESIERTTGEPILASQTRVVLLIDKGSASASEIVAGALKDSKRATLIGQKTFGKGSAQRIFDLKDGSSLRVTIAKLKTPGGKEINEKGIEPDIPVEESLGSRDAALLRALEMLR